MHCLILTNIEREKRLKMKISNISSPIQSTDFFLENNLYLKREDLIPYSFGGNKARKALLFFDEVNKGGHDVVVTYGSSSSNLVRVVSNLCAGLGKRCIVITPKEASIPSFNSKLSLMFNAEIITVPVEEVHDTIENTMDTLKKEGHNPYFIPGGGHGNIGTRAYVDCYEEIRDFEQDNDIFFDYIFFASGTGTTQAGLVAGQLIYGDERQIVGISIARPNPRGRQVVLDSIEEYLNGSHSQKEIEEKTIFDDRYIGDGYGKETSLKIIKDVMTVCGVPLDSTYTGKAFFGMTEYIREHNIKGKNILFIHTGGTPLFFDTIGKF